MYCNKIHIKKYLKGNITTVLTMYPKKYKQYYTDLSKISVYNHDNAFFYIVF